MASLGVCRQQSFDPLDPTPVQLANFLTRLHLRANVTSFMPFHSFQQLLFVLQKQFASTKTLPVHRTTTSRKAWRRFSAMRRRGQGCRQKSLHRLKLWTDVPSNLLHETKYCLPRSGFNDAFCPSSLSLLGYTLKSNFSSDIGRRKVFGFRFFTSQTLNISVEWNPHSHWAIHDFTTGVKATKIPGTPLITQMTSLAILLITHLPL